MSRKFKRLIPEKSMKDETRVGFGPCCPCDEDRHQDCILGPCECGCGRPTKKNIISFGQTERHFARGDFVDRYGSACSVQDSSIATENCLWLGVDRPSIKTGPPWVDLKIPDDAFISSRMHLTVSQAVALRDVLDRFIETGNCEP